MLAETLFILNNDKIIWGVTMLLLNIGSRYVLSDLGMYHEKILKHELFKKLIVFSMFFVATRDIITSFILTVLYVILIDGIFHEKSKFTIVHKTDKTDNTSTIKEEDYMKAKKIVEEYERANLNTGDGLTKEKSPYDIYLSNINYINNTI
jgi:uncharacterized membrane protein (DUF485 family)